MNPYLSPLALQFNLEMLVVLGLATWRVSNILVHEEGPWYVARKIRQMFGVVHDDDGPISYPDNSVFACMYCMSVWVGVVMLALPSVCAMPFALSAFAIFVHMVRVVIENGNS